MEEIRSPTCQPEKEKGESFIRKILSILHSSIILYTISSIQLKKHETCKEVGKTDP